MNHRKHWERVRELGCIVSGTNQFVTIHHCHGGSITDHLGWDASPGMGRRQNHFLVIPLALELHSVGPEAIDGSMGVRKWESIYGTQIDMLKEVNKRLPYNLWAAAEVVEPCTKP